MDSVLVTGGFLLASAGLLGAMLPLLPGAPFILLGALLLGWSDGFNRVGWLTITALAGLTLLSLLVDVGAASLGARRSGASPLAVSGAVAGTVVGVFFALPGLVVGPFLGAIAGELLAGRRLKQAGRAGLSTWAGLLLGGALKLAIALVMIGALAAAWTVI